MLGTDQTTSHEPAGPPFLAPEPDDAEHARALVAAHEHRWNWAQRGLEEVVRRTPDGRAAEDLTSVRTARRCLRALAKRPRDAAIHLELARAYLELEMGADGERVLREAAVLAPENPEPLYLLALEHYYRGEQAEAERAYALARERAPDLPELSTVLASLEQHLRREDTPSDIGHAAG